MSLQLAAQHIAHKGRGPDTTLVHMSRNEVKSLNDLAMAHGGHLTINPQTGLPEAGFLSSILPMIAGVALGPAGFGLTAMQAGLAGGALGMLTNPKAGLMGGLMAGLGAYGGAGLGAGLSGLATSEAGATAANAATTASEEAAKQELLKQQALQASAKEAVLSNPSVQNIDAMNKFTPDYIKNAVQSTREYAADSFVPKTPIPTGMNAVFQGAKSLATDPTMDKFKALGGGNLMTLGAAAVPVVSHFLQPENSNPQAPVSQKSIAPRYKFDPGMKVPTPVASPTGVENNYFQPKYSVISDEEAKSMYGYAGGGPIEQMSNNNAIGANTGFPQSYLHNDTYATPYQMPVAQNVLKSTGDALVDPYTGEQKMATGGEVDEYTYDPATQMYIKKPKKMTPMVAPVNGISEAIEGGGGGGGGSERGTTSNNPGGVQTKDSLVNSMLSSATLGSIVNALGSKQDPAPVESRTGNLTDAGAMALGASGVAQAGGDFGAVGGGFGGDGTGGGDGSGKGFGGVYARGGDIHMANTPYNLGSYSDGGRLLRGPGDGVSDSIPAMIGKKQPARLADGEFVIPARIVSELGNGSTEAGARRLYAMMDRVQSARKSTIGKGKVAKNSRADKYLPA